MLKKLYIAAIVVLVMAGCKKDPGLLGPTDAYSTTTYPHSLGDLQSVLSPGYSNLRSAALFGFNLMPKALANATHTANSSYGEQAWNEMTNNNLGVNNQFSKDAWASFYTGVKNCNVAIKASNFYKTNGMKPGEEKDVNYVLGQAYFLRAFYYFQLECYYGESYIRSGAGGDKMGVPIYDEIPETLDATQKPRSTVRETWDFIEKDLLQSADLLKGKVWTGDDRGRISEWAAKALLGKSYVFTQDWAKAKPVLLDVIQNSGKSLMPYAKYRESFLGHSDSEFNEESLFELNVDPDSKGDYGPYGNTPNATVLYGVIWSPFALGFDGTETGSMSLGYGNEGFHDKNVQRFGYPLGYYTLVNNPNFKTGQSPSYKNPPKVMDPVYKQAAENVRTNKLADPRLYVNALQPWLDSVKFDGSNWFPVSKPNYFGGQPNTYGWSFRKYTNIDYSLNDKNAQGNNLYFLRLADVFLLYAEAAKGLGDNTTALEYLNKVKRRAYSYPINAPSPVDYTSLTGVTKAINDPVLGTNPLYYERWAELFNESDWWFDVCRWKLGKSEAAYYVTAINVGGQPFTFNEAKSYSWPIPTDEFNSNAKITGQQNPGY
ncbi:hypothetical protein ABIB40_002600 [Pedobacter sp. UYP30]|uniref:RagB/SusD family nutrient uptake outer membrane protein n=1 Tax=Pedobacter sp. UYP30 TaxID=1756400 RepID=UPI003390F749